MKSCSTLNIVRQAFAAGMPPTSCKAQSAWHCIGEKAALVALLQHGPEGYKAPHNAPGFQVLPCGKCCCLCRHIEASKDGPQQRHQ